MSLAEYIVKAAGVWFLGFFPLAEIYVAVPAGVAAGLDNASTVFWSVLGNYTPVLLIYFFYNQMTRHERLRGWLAGLASEKVRVRVDKYGLWVVLLGTPWTGVWIMATAGRLLGMTGPRLLTATFISVLVYAVAIVTLIAMGVDAFSAGS